MGVCLDRSFMVGTVLEVLIVLVLFGMCTCQNPPENFVFGDSLVDAGNNNYIASLSKANFFPHGIDFGRPTGRFTNGRTIVDILGQELGIGFVPPYLAPTPTGMVVLRGVNYASGGSGILNETGKGGRINFDAQLDNFANTRLDIISMIGLPQALNLFKRAILSVSTGSNDFINNYLTPTFSLSEYKLASPELYRLYNLVARKIVVVNLGPIGCIPGQRDANPDAGNGRVAFPNQLAQLFNSQLKSLLAELHNNLQGSMFVHADVYRILGSILENYVSYGFENPSSSCCYIAGRFGGLIPCSPPSKVCWDGSMYVFWDPNYHPTEAVNAIIAKRLLDGDSNDISPVNFRKLSAS